MSEILALLKDLESRRFWGNVEFEFRDGRITLIRRVETIKPSDYRMEKSHDHVQTSKFQPR